MVKTEYNPELDTAKQTSRLAVRTFGALYLPRDRRNVRMLCFPSVGYYDVSEIAIPLGIRMGNITGLEKYRDVYEEMVPKNPGIDLKNVSALDFFKTTQDKFDLISLDYPGEFTPEVFDTIRNIFGRRVLKSKGILHTNFYGAREPDSVKKLYQTYHLTGEVFSSLIKNYDDIIKFRDDGIIMIHKDDIDKMFKEVENNFSDMGSLRNGITRTILVSAFQGNSNLTKSSTELLRFWYGEETKRLIENGTPFYLAEYVKMKTDRPYFCDALRRFKYVSNDGSPMLTDLFLLDEHSDWFDEKLYPIYHNPVTSIVKIGNKEIRFPEQGHSAAVIPKYLISISPFERRYLQHAFNVGYKTNPSFIETMIKEREFLGSSTKPIMSEERARDMVSKGISIEEILRGHRGVTKQQLAAFKAWKTMRERKTIVEEPKPVDPKEEREALSDFYR